MTQIFRAIAITIAVAILLPHTTFLSAQSTEAAQRITFRGNTTFTDDELLATLSGQPDFLLAMHPLAEPLELNAVTTKLLRAGYRAAGYGDVVIVAESALHPSELVCKIAEGERYVRDEILIDGCKVIDAQQLKDHFTKRMPKEGWTPTLWSDGESIETVWTDKDGAPQKLSDPDWTPGEKIALDSEREFSRSVNKALKSLGFSNAFALVKLAPDMNTHTVDLQISIVNENEPDRIANIEVTGLQRNSETELLKWLDLEPGQQVSESRLQQMRARLWQCGRFEKFEVSHDHASGKLSIIVTEIPYGPRLGESFNEIAGVVLKMRQWLIDAHQRNDDTEFAFQQDDMGMTVHAIQSSSGLFVQHTSEPSDGNHQARTATIFVDAEHLIIDHSDNPTCFHVGLGLVEGKVWFTTTLRGAKDPEKGLNFVFNGNINSRRADDELPCSHHWRMTPADAISLAYHPNVETNLTSSELTIRNKGSEIRIARESGQIQSWTSENSTIRFAPGLLDQVKQPIIDRVTAKPNSHLGQHGISTFASYLISPPFVSIYEHYARQSNPDAASVNPVAISAARKMVDDGALCIADEILCRVIQHEQNRSDDEFSIPSDQVFQGNFQQVAAEFVARAVLNAAPELLPESGWPMKVTREACLTAMRRNKYSGMVLKELLLDENNGPLCHASVAGLLSLIGQDSRKAFAARGLLALSPELFATDYEALTGVIQHELFIKTIRSVQTLSHVELQAVKGAVKNDTLSQLLDFAALHPLESTDDEVDFWYQIAKVQLEPWLQAMAR
ncbi:BamA/TamA family outer membrane protein [Stieleria varia]|nr:hypothetical protein [Stieleria varia]